MADVAANNGALHTTGDRLIGLATQHPTVAVGPIVFKDVVENASLVTNAMQNRVAPAWETIATMTAP